MPVDGLSTDGQETLDARIHPFRADIAAEHLRGRVKAERYVPGRLYQVIQDGAFIRQEPASAAQATSQVLYGEHLTVYEIADGWAWGQIRTDNYVGYVPVEALSIDVFLVTHHVAVARAPLFKEPSVKAPVIGALGLHAGIQIDRSEGEYHFAPGLGWVHQRHVTTVNSRERDPVTVAEQLIGAPYVWGGRSASGLDCSGLVQLACARCGIAAGRDSDMQAESLGTPLSNVDLNRDAPSGLARGDIVFFSGHVGVMRDSTTFLHANAYHMKVASEPLSAAVSRIRSATGAGITTIRRLDAA